MKNKTNREKTALSSLKTVSLSLVLALLILSVLSSGCIQEESTNVKYIDVPMEQYGAMNDFINDIKNAETGFIINLYSIADKAGKLTDYDDIETLLRDSYSENPGIDRLVYYDNVKGNFINVPNQYLNILTDYTIPPGDSDFASAGGFIYSTNIEIEDHGYMDIAYTAVYDDSGKYKGYVAVFYDLFDVLSASGVIDEDTKYGDSVVYLVDRKNQITYSSRPEFVGKSFTKDKELHVKETILIYQEDDIGAYSYTSQAFYIYIKEALTNKVTSWQKFRYNDMDYTVYMTKEIYPPEISYKDLAKPNTKGLKEEVTAAYIDSKNGFDFVKKKISNEEYQIPLIYALDFNGIMTAAPNDDRYQVGSSYLNARDAYGSAHGEKAVIAAGLGSGYMKAVMPVSGTVLPEAGLFSIGYAISTSEDWFVLGFTPADTKFVPIDHDLKSNLVQVGRAVVKTAYNKGNDWLIDNLNSHPSQSGGVGNRYVYGADYESDKIVIMDYEGNIMANTLNPELVGLSYTGYTDAIGTSVTRTCVMLAKSGGGIAYDLDSKETYKFYDPSEAKYAKPANNLCDLWLYSVEPIDDNYFVIYGVVVDTLENPMDS